MLKIEYVIRWDDHVEIYDSIAKLLEKTPLAKLGDSDIIEIQTPKKKVIGFLFPKALTTLKDH